MKDILLDNRNDRVIASIKNIILERLWLLALSMKDKETVGECGTVLNKSAAGEDYKWGLRFYVLLIECFREWASAMDDADIIQKYARIKEVAPILEEDVYYFQALEHAPLDHSRVDEILREFQAMSPAFRSPKSRHANNAPPSFVAELDTFKKNFLDSLFAKTPNPNAIVEIYIMYQSYFDSIKDKAFGYLSDPAIGKDIKFAQLATQLQWSEDLHTEKGLGRFRKSVVDSIREAYGQIPREYGGEPQDLSRSYKNQEPNVRAQYINHEEAIVQPIQKFSKKSEPVVENDVYEARMDRSTTPNNKRRREPEVEVKEYEGRSRNGNNGHGQKEGQQSQPRSQNSEIIKPASRNERVVRDKSPYRNEDFEFQLNRDHSPIADPEKLQQENQKLKEKKMNIIKEIERLKEKERQMKETSYLKTDSREISKIEATPEILIEEINRKSREYDMLKHKYSNLITEMNRKVKGNIEKTMFAGGENGASFDSFVSYSRRNFENSMNSRESYYYTKQSGLYDRNFF